jgi:Txe/YoeB family toxin of Txe-Axe toxin-antitoxin module
MKSVSMKVYHVVYFAKVDDRVSKGVNIESESMLEAIASFVKDYDVDPFSIVLKTETLYASKNSI